MRIKLMLVAILACAGALQFVALGDKSLWRDEVIAVEIAAQPTLSEVMDEFRVTENQPPFYYLLLHFWILAYGREDAVVRLPSAIFSLGSVAAFYFLARRLTDERTSLLATFLLAVSPFLVLFGRMARYFSTSLFFATLSTLVLIEAMKRWEEGDSARWWIRAYALSAVVMLLTNYMNVAVFGVHILFAWLRYRDIKRKSPDTDRHKTRFRGLMGTFGTAAIAFGIWIVGEASRSVDRIVSGPGHYNISGWREIALGFAYPPYAFGLGETIFPWHPAAAVALVAVAVALTAGAVRVFQRVDRGVLVVGMVVVSLFVTLGTFFVIVRDIQFEPVASRAIAALPFFVLIVAVGILRLPRLLGGAAALAVLIAYAFGISNYFVGRDFHNPVYAVPTREIAESIRQGVRRGDTVVAEPDIHLDYYYEPSHQKISRAPRSQADVIELLALHPSGTQVWLVTFGRDRTRAEEPDLLKEWLQDHAQLLSVEGYVPQDPTYSKLKERIQGFPDYKFKAEVRVFRLLD